MQIFELHFNPENKEKIAESFFHNSQDIHERRLGKLCMVGEISGMKNKDHSLLQNLFYTAKKTYYSDPGLSPEQALNNTLRKINESLKENDHQGSIDVAILSSKNFSIYFSRTGRVKIILLGKKKIEDIGQELDNSTKNLFQNMITGKIKGGEKLLILTPEIYHSFSQGGLFEKIKQDSLSGKIMEEISSLQKEKFPNASGVSFVIDYTLIKKEEPQLVSKNKRFSFRKLFEKKLLSIKKISPRKIFSSLFGKFPQIKTPRPKIRLPGFKQKSILLPLIFLTILLIGYVAIGIESSIRVKRQEGVLFEIRESITLGKESKDIVLLKDTLTQLEKLKKERTLLHKEIEEKYITLENELLQLSMWEEVENIKLLLSFNETEIEEITLKENTLYLSSAQSSEVISVNLETGQKEIHTLPIKQVNFSSSSGDRTIFFSHPNSLLFLHNEEISILEHLEDDYSFVSLSSFYGIPYLLTAKGEIIVYQDKYPRMWIEEKEKRTNNPLSMAIDGAIYVLNEDNKIYRYYGGRHEEEIAYNIFPEFSAQKIYTAQESPLVFLDKEEKRIIIASKEGEVEKQLHSKKMENPKSLAFSSEQNKIYLLDNQKVYLIEL